MKNKLFFRIIIPKQIFGGSRYCFKVKWIIRMISVGYTCLWPNTRAHGIYFFPGDWLADGNWPWHSFIHYQNATMGAWLPKAKPDKKRGSKEVWENTACSLDSTTLSLGKLRKGDENKVILILVEFTLLLCYLLIHAWHSIPQSTYSS